MAFFILSRFPLNLQGESGGTAVRISFVQVSKQDDQVFIDRLRTVSVTTSKQLLSITEVFNITCEASDVRAAQQVCWNCCLKLFCEPSTCWGSYIADLELVCQGMMDQHFLRQKKRPESSKNLDHFQFVLRTIAEPGLEMRCLKFQRCSVADLNR